MIISSVRIFIIALSSLMISCGGSTSITETPQVAGIAIGAAQAADGERYTAQLSGAQVLPPVNSRHTGQADFQLDNQTGQLFGTVSTSILNVDAVHLHEGRAGEVGAKLVALIASEASAGNVIFNLPAGFILTTQQQSAYNSGELYVDVHSADVELRGQLSHEQPQLSIAANLDDLQAKLFTPVCSGCHTGGGNDLPAIMDLSNANATYSNLVGVYSIGEADILRVNAGETDSSLLVNKLEGTQNIGARMPFRGAKLDVQTIDAVKRWINSGANR